MLRRGRERAVANRHPWIFTGAIASESGPDDAAIADLVDEHGSVLASGFHSKHSQIRLRALTFGDEVLSADMIRERIVRAIDAGLAEGINLVDGRVTNPAVAESLGMKHEPL